MIPTPIQVLLIEDNPGDADLIRETLETDRLQLQLSVVTDGPSALAFLAREAPYASAPTPDLVLLDLNIPKLDGREVLAAMKARDDVRHIPVVVLTSSDAERDIVQSYRLGASCYLTKPLDFTAFRNIVRAIEGFWFTVVKLP
jgi:CheY-like chemotaxis protein